MHSGDSPSPRSPAGNEHSETELAHSFVEGNRLESEIIEILDEEKERLGRELRDGLCQTLTGISASSATLSKKLAGSIPTPSKANGQTALAAASAAITRRLNDAVGEARNLAHGLGPPSVDVPGLGGALAAFAGDVESMFRVSCTFTCHHPLPGLPPETERHLLRIAQQAVNNAVAHGNGRGCRIEIRLGSKGGTGLLRVSHNGAGIPARARNPHDTGLQVMAYRARLISGSIEVRPHRRGGTAVLCAFPLSSHSGARGEARALARTNRSTPAPPARKTILIVDAHPMTRRGLANLIEPEPDLAICGEAASVQAALETIHEGKPDLVIVALVLARSDGLDLLKEMKRRHPKIPALVLSTYDEAVYGERSLRAGARGYLHKETPGETVLVAVRRVLAGETYMSKTLERRLAARFVAGRNLATGSPLEALSDRELQVFRLIGQGRSTRQIAATLYLSVKTIESHREHIKRKLVVDSANELVHRATRWVETTRVR